MAALISTVMYGSRGTRWVREALLALLVGAAYAGRVYISMDTIYSSPFKVVYRMERDYPAVV